MSLPKALVVDDERAIRDLLREVLSADGFEVEEASTGEEALSKIAAVTFDIYLFDIHLPDITGIDLMERMGLKDQPSEAIVISGEQDLNFVKQAMEQGAFTFLTKPFRVEDVSAKVSQAFQVARWKGRRMAYAKQMEQLRSFILTTVAHELRTPLSAFSNYLSVLEKHGAVLPAAESAAVYAGLRDAQARMTGVVGNIIDISKISDPDAPLAPRRIDLAALVAEKVKGLQPLANAKGVVFVSDFLFQPPHWETDGDLLGMALRCLLGNAVNFNCDRGKVRVAVREKGAGEAALLMLSVADEGPGVDRGVVEILSKPSAINDQLWLYQRGGMGVGLFIALRVAELLKGNISVETPAAGGAVFTLTLPRLAVAEKEKGD